jgi:hypothetical protein
MGLDTKTYWLTDRQSQCDFDFDLTCSSSSSSSSSSSCCRHQSEICERFFIEIRETVVVQKKFNVWAVIINCNCKEVSINLEPIIISHGTRNTWQLIVLLLCSLILKIILNHQRPLLLRNLPTLIYLSIHVCLYSPSSLTLAAFNFLNLLHSR